MNPSRDAAESIPEAPLPHFELRLLVLAALLLVVAYWVPRHFFVGGFLEKCWAVGGSVLAFAGTLVGLIGERTREHTEKRFLARLRRPILVAMDSRVLIPAVLIGLCVGSMVTTVKVGAAETDEPVDVTVRVGGKERTKTIRPSHERVSFVCFTTPFGRPVSVKASGRLRKSFEVYPWVGRILHVEQDLQESPTVLLRIPPGEAHTSLLGGRWVITHRGEERTVENDGKNGAIRIGSSRPVTAERIELWRLSLSGRGENETKRTLAAWMNRRVLDREVLPGDIVGIRFENARGVVTARLEFQAGTEDFQDLIMEDVIKEDGDE